MMLLLPLPLLLPAVLDDAPAAASALVTPARSAGLVVPAD